MPYGFEQLQIRLNEYAPHIPLSYTNDCNLTLQVLCGAVIRLAELPVRRRIDAIDGLNALEVGVEHDAEPFGRIGLDETLDLIHHALALFVLPARPGLQELSVPRALQHEIPPRPISLALRSQHFEVG